MMELNTEAKIAFVISVIALLAYPLTMRLLAHLVQPTRLRMADLGNELLASPHVNELGKDIILSMLKDAYSWQAMAEFVVYMPVYVVKRARGKKPKLGMEIRDASTRKKFDDFVSNHMTSAAAANPLCCVIMVLEMAIVFGILTSVGAMTKINEVMLSASVYAEPPSRKKTIEAI